MASSLFFLRATDFPFFLPDTAWASWASREDWSGSPRGDVAGDGSVGERSTTFFSGLPSNCGEALRGRFGGGGAMRLRGPTG